MANWRNKLKIKDLLQDDKFTIAEKQIEIAKRIRVLSTKWRDGNPLREQLENLVDQFEAVEDSELEFNGVLEDLYDWGDQTVRTLPTDIRGIPSRMCFME